MKITKFFALIVFIFCSVAMNAQNWGSYGNGNNSYTNSKQSSYAKITFKNNSDYTMTLKIMYLKGGVYSTVTLLPRSRKEVAFGHTNTFKLKIKAVHGGSTSYHDGGNFSVTCTDTEWTEGEMSFSLSTYGSGLGPSISAKEFESND